MNDRKRIRQPFRTLLPIAVWIIVWQLASMAVNKILLIPGPYDVFLSLKIESKKVVLKRQFCSPRTPDNIWRHHLAVTSGKWENLLVIQWGRGARVLFLAHIYAFTE